MKMTNIEPITKLLLDYCYGSLVVVKKDGEKRHKIRRIELRPNHIDVFVEDGLVVITIEDIVNYLIVVQAENDSEESHGDFTLEANYDGIMVDYRFFIMPLDLDFLKKKDEGVDTVE